MKRLIAEEKKIIAEKKKEIAEKRRKLNQRESHRDAQVALDQVIKEMQK